MSQPITKLTREDVERIAEQVSNWGRWGADDQRGALNLITEAKRAAAAALVQDGQTVSCALPFPVTPAVDNPNPALHYMIHAGDAQDPRYGHTADFIALAPHGLGATHLDALCHIFVRGQMYNGFDMHEVRSNGARRNSIMAAADGVVTRGVLLDIPALRGLPWLEPREPITVDDLDAAEARQGVTVAEGDALLIATGRDARRDELGPWGADTGFAGLYADCIPWLHQRGVALLGCDGVSDAVPSGIYGHVMPIHHVLIASMGVHLIDNMQLGRLLDACRQRGRWEFLFVLAPLRIEGGTASPVNPLAIF